MTFAVHPDVAWLPWDDSHVVAMRLPRGEPITLTGTAAAIFLDVADGLDPVAEALERWPDHAEDVRAQAPRFLDELIAAGLVVSDAAPAGRARARRAAPDDAPPTPDVEAVPRDEVRAESVTETGTEQRPYRILFVCTANICRSAYADVVARAAGLDGVEFSSAGTHALVGAAIDPPMAAELPAGDPGAHQSRQLTRDVAGSADLIVTMAEQHRRFVLDEWPRYAQKTFVIGHVAREMRRLPEGTRLPDLTEHLWANRQAAPDDSVADPYRQGPAAAAACARTIDSKLTDILEGLQTLLRAERP